MVIHERAAWQGKRRCSSPKPMVRQDAPYGMEMGCGEREHHVAAISAGRYIVVMTVASPPAVYPRSETRPKPAAVSGPTAPPPRITSIDALRGFDMFWIMGPYVGYKMVHGLSKWIWGSRELSPAWIRYHFDHAPWEGFAAWDLIMPLFLFVVGVAMPFSIGRRIDEGASRTSIYLKMIRRVIILWILGMIS